jgi:hypothetical protein
MSRHRITVEELTACLEAEAWHDIACSFGKGSAKRLDISNDGTLRVTDHKKVTYAGKDKGDAVAAYNDAQ